MAVRSLADLDNVDQARACLERRHVGGEGCWIDQGNLRWDGYGRIQVRSHGGWFEMPTHRLAYLLHYGTLPALPLMVLHCCHQRRCVNPAHLKVGDHQANMRDMKESGRACHGPEHQALQRARAKRGAQSWSALHPERLARGDQNGSRLHPESVPRGERHPRARLSNEAVREMRRLRQEGWTYVALGQRYGITANNASMICRRRTWTHVD